MKTRGKPGLRDVGFGVLLIALAIQGITPDPDDLASGSLTRLLATVFSSRADGVDSSPDHASWPDENSEDREQAADDVCIPALSGIRPLSRTEAHRSRLPGQFSSDSTVGIPPSLSPSEAIPRAPALTQRQRIHTLCRLTC
jgi:hypothetical protein